MEKHKLLIVITTSDSVEELNRIGSDLVEKRLAACVQVNGPITSHYFWQDRKEESQEWQLKAKTVESLYSQVERRIKELHSYDLPQIIAIPVTHALQDFSKWVESSVSP